LQLINLVLTAPQGERCRKTKEENLKADILISTQFAP